MKLSYYGYWFNSIASSKKPYSVNLAKICENFCKYFSNEIKTSLKSNGENQYLIHEGGKLFIFIQTRSEELIKKIDAKNITVSEIYDSLSADENIGFASYVYIDDKFLAFGSTLMAPRIKSFIDFINSILDIHQITNYRFGVTPFLTQTSPKEIKRAHHIGKTTIKVNKSNSFYNEIEEFFGGNASNFDDVESFEIVIRPTKRKDISPAVVSIVNKMEQNEEGIEKFIIAAKKDDDERLTDYYLNGRGLVANYFDIKKERNIEAAISKKIEINQELAERISANEKYLSKVEAAAILDLYKHAAWTDLSVHLSRPKQ